MYGSERITAEQAAKRLGITTRTLFRWRERGKLKDAGTAGRTVMFYAGDVDALLGIKAGVTLEDVYKRLAAAESWEDVHALQRDIAASIATHADADGKAIVEQSYRAACAMAATHPQQEARDRWRRTAEQYGTWLGKSTEDVAALIERRATLPYHKAEAEAEAEAAPLDPVLAVINASMSANRQ